MVEDILSSIEQSIDSQRLLLGVQINNLYRLDKFNTVKDNCTEVIDCLSRLTMNKSVDVICKVLTLLQEIQNSSAYHAEKWMKLYNKANGIEKYIMAYNKINTQLQNIKNS